VRDLPIPSNVVDSRLISLVEPSALVQEFLPLNRRRTRGDPPLTIAELERWMELRWRLEHALAGKTPIDDQDGPMRRTLRVPTHLKVRFTRGSTIDISSTQEISEGGLFLITRRPLAPGTPLHLEINAGDLDAPIEVEGTVTWVRSRDDGSGPTGMGIRFNFPDQEKQAAITTLVERTLSEAL
jgi:uncharacterized protein (TIGR02266 family)